MRLNDFRHAIRYFGYTGLIPNQYIKEWKLENMYMESQGNLSAFQRSHYNFLDRPY